MKYLRTTLATDWNKEKSLSQIVLETVLFFVPKANPGYENKIHLVKEWMLEFDQENKPLREIALDDTGYPIFAGPSDENYGFWLDTNMTSDENYGFWLDTNMTYYDFEGIEVQSYEFENLWAKFGV